MIHYLILAHNNFDQLELLVNKIKNKNSKIYIHVDKKVKEFPKFENVYYIKDRQNITWWWTKILKAELIWISEIYKNMKEWDHVIILSGACFPIKDNEYIDWLKNKSCLSYYLAPEKEKKRVTDYRFFDINFHIPSRINRYLIKLISHFKNIDKDIKLSVVNFCLSKFISLLLPKRRFIINNYQIYKWDARIVLSYNHIKYLLNFLGTAKWKRVLNCFKYTNIPDELFFQTLLVNEKKEELVNKCVRFYIWPRWASCPNFLTKDNLDDIKKSEKLFARKIDHRKDKGLLEIL